MSMNFDETKKATNREKIIVNGYIKKCQYLLPSNEPYYNIPQLIYFTVIAFYHKCEYFTKHGDKIEINDKYDTATNKTSTYNTVYGNIDINGNESIIYVWKIKIILVDLIIFGIDSSNKKHLNNRFSANYTSGWIKNEFEFYGCGFSIDCIWSYTKEIDDQECDYGIKKGDIITMELNLRNKTLKWYINDQYINFILTKINFDNKKYNMAIELRNSSVQLIDYQINNA